MKTDYELMKALNISEPDAPLTRGELVTYLHKVITAERDRLAWIVEDPESTHPRDLASFVRGTRKDKAVFGWPE